MKKVIFVYLFTVSQFIFAQANRVTFAYDSGGNQTQRLLCVNCTSQRMGNPDAITDDSEIESKELIEDNVKYYPNPVSEVLNVSWSNLQEKYVTEIVVFSFSGQLVNQYSITENQEEKSLDFKNLPSAIYHLVLVYSNGEKKSMKLIKK